MPENTNDTKPVEYLNISNKRLIGLLLLTFGFYELYWFYKNWAAIRDATGQKMWPFWRAVFSIFWIHRLFQEIWASAVKTDYRPKFSAKTLATVYVVTCIISGITSYAENIQPWVWLPIAVIAVVVDACVLATAQKVVSHCGGTGLLPRHKTTKGEVAVVVLGVVVTLIVITTAFLPKEPTQLSPKQQALYDKYKRLSDDYDNCSSALDIQQEALDTNDPQATRAFAADEQKCEAIRGQQNKATDEYNASLDR